MTLELRYSVEAGEDLIDIWNYIAAENSRAAERVLNSIETKCDRLRDFPLIGPSRDDLRPGFRMLVADEYVILYRAMQDRVEIIRVLHGKRGLDGLLP